MHYGYLLEATLVITGLRASPSACWSRSCRIHGYMCLKRRVKPLTFISLTIAWNNPPSAPHSFSTDSTFILSIFSEYRSEKNPYVKLLPQYAAWVLKAEECFRVRARFQQKSLSSADGLLPRGLRQMMGRDEREVAYSLSLSLLDSGPTLRGWWRLGSWMALQ